MPHKKSTGQTNKNIKCYKGFKKGEQKVFGERQKVYQSIQKYFDGGNMGMCGQNHEGKRLYKELASNENFLYLAK